MPLIRTRWVLIRKAYFPEESPKPCLSQKSPSTPGGDSARGQLPGPRPRGCWGEIVLRVRREMPAQL